MDVHENAIIQSEGGVAIEDLLLIEDFEKVVSLFDAKVTVDPSLSSSKALTKSGINKVLLARHFSESVTSGKSRASDISEPTKVKVVSLFERLSSGLAKQPLIRDASKTNIL